MALFRAPKPKEWRAFVFTTEDDDDDPPLEELTAYSKNDLLDLIDDALDKHGLMHRFTEWSGRWCDVYGARIYDGEYSPYR